MPRNCLRLLFVRAIFLSAGFVCLTQIASAVDIFLSPITTVGGGVAKTAPNIDLGAIGNGNTSTLGIWIDRNGVASLNGISLNLVSSTPGVISFNNTANTSVPNPNTTSGKRWYDNAVDGFSIESISSDQVSNIFGVALTGLSISNPGQGLGVAGDTLFDSPYHLFATVEYTVLDSGGSTNLFLQIGSNSIINNSDSYVTNVVLGNDADPALDASLLGSLNVSTATPEAVLGMASISTGDFDSDGDVDGSDFLAWQAGFGGAGGLSQGDANGDGNITAADLMIWQTQYGSGNGGGSLASAAVPEPTAIVLSVFAALATAVHFLRKR